MIEIFKDNYEIHLLLILYILVANQVVSAQSVVLSEKKLHILTLGDSNGSFPYSWPQQLKLALPNSEIFNISKSGRTIGFLNLGDTILNSLMVINDNLKKAADNAHGIPYDFIILDLGTNDAKAVFASRQQEVVPNLQKLISIIKTCSYDAIKNAKILIISPTPFGTKAEATEKYIGGEIRVKAMSNTFYKVAQQNSCLFINGQTISGLDVETMTADGLHLDAVASRKLIVPIVAAITSN